jgi:hypothetical protein
LVITVLFMSASVLSNLDLAPLVCNHNLSRHRGKRLELDPCWAAAGIRPWIIVPFYCRLDAWNKNGRRAIMDIDPALSRRGRDDH